jgi:Uma2 family endonuclease
MAIDLGRDLETEGSGGHPRRWTRKEYHRAAELGLFRPDERLELIRGEIIVVSPQKELHYAAIYSGAEALKVAFGPGYWVRQQGPLVLGEDSEPEPDLLIVPGSWQDYRKHPTAAQVLLLIEVADTTLRTDRGSKAALYAEAGVADYWIVNVRARALEVYRDLGPLSKRQAAFGYRSKTVYQEGETVISLSAPHAVIRVADLLPPVW